MAQEFYFAWVDDGNTSFGPEHHVNDEVIVGFNLTHQQNEAAGLTISLKNPRVGPLNPSRKQWAWVSYRKKNDTVVPLFHGRVVAMPSDFDGNVVIYEFTARPSDAEEQKKDLAATLRVAPYWDPIFINDEQRDDPDAVLTARPALWHFGRTDKLVSVSNILAGEDGSIVLGPSDVIWDTLNVQVNKPVRSVAVTATVEWKQAASGVLDMTGKLTEAFGQVGSPNGYCSSYTGDGLEQTWPKFGDTIGGGWSVDYTKANLTNTRIEDSHILQVNINPLNDTPPDDLDPNDPNAYEKWLTERMKDPIRQVRLARWDFRPQFWIRYEAERTRKEKLTFTLVADMQAVDMDLPEESAFEEIDVDSSTVADADPVTNEIPLGNHKKRSYFNSDRAQDSIAFLINLARSRLLMAARCVELTIQLRDFDVGVDLSCRHDVILSIPDIPGGAAGGKIIGYGLSLLDGAAVATVTFAATAGKGNSLVPPDDGEPSYVIEDYVGDDYQIFYGSSLQPVAGEVEYERPEYTPTDDNIDFENMTPNSVLLDLQATALLTFTAPGTDGNTVTIGGRTYTLRNTFTTPSVPDEVKIGIALEETALNLAAAIERLEIQEGTTFSAGTVAHAQVSGTAQDGIVRVMARVGGVSGNSIAVSAVGPMTWDNTHLYDGSKGLVVQNGPGEQEDVMKAMPEPGSVNMAEERLNAHFTLVQMALKPVTGGPFETIIPLEVSHLMVPKTINLEANPV